MINIEDFEYFAMGTALSQAKLAAEIFEVPVGACIYKGEKLISAAYNKRETDRNALAHAELLAIDSACKALGGWRLHECDLYVTLEPCAMCTGAIINSRIKRVVFGAKDPKAGCMGSLLTLTDYNFNHKPEITSGIRQQECTELLQTFFAQLRQRKKQK